METLNLDAVEQQQIIITVALNNSDGTPADLTQYACYAASVGQQDPYTRRAPRKEWAAAINNESSAYILTAPGLEMAAAPWRYSIYLKDRRLGLEWVICTGRITLTPRACGTDGISPAAYSISAECTPSGLVNVSLDATVGSISGTLEEVKASAALASTSAANAHADLEDARKAATTAAQAATTAAADANNAMDAAARAEKAATDAPQACAPFVGQVQSAAVQAQQAATHAEEDANRASTAATTATEKAQHATDAAEAAASSAANLAAARDTAVQASTTAQAAQQTAQLASTTATTAAENAREYAEDAQQAKQASATSETNAATSAQQASDSASAAAASAQSAQTSAATAVSAKSDLETARDTATAAAATATDAATAAATSETNATTAATAAATAQAAAEAAQAQAGTDARACAIYDQRVAANATAATEAATTATEAATTATEAATTATEAAGSMEDAELESMVNLCQAVYACSNGNAIEYSGPIDKNFYNLRSLFITSTQHSDGNFTGKIVVILKNPSYGWGDSYAQVFFAPELTGIYSAGQLLANNYSKKCYVYVPAVTCFSFYYDQRYRSVVFGSRFDNLVEAHNIGNPTYAGDVEFAPGTTFANLKNGFSMLQSSKSTVNLPDTVTFEKLENGSKLMYKTLFTRLPQSMTLASLKAGVEMFSLSYNLEAEDIVRVCKTINDLQALDTPKTGTIGLPSKCKHNGAEVANTLDYLNANHPDFLTTLSAKGWTVSFS